MTGAIAALVGLAVLVADGPAPVLKGRLDGYRGLFPFHVFVLREPDFGRPGVIAATGTADPDTGKFDIQLPVGGGPFYLFGQLDLERQGPTLIGRMVFPLRKEALFAEDLAGVRHLFDLGDMELAHVVRDSGPGSAVGVALGLAILLYGVGFLWARRLPRSRAPAHVEAPQDRLAWCIALATTALLIPNYASEPLALLEFTYAQEAFRPASPWALLFDPISAELSHPPLWALLTRALGSLSRHEGWLRLPAILAHIPLVLVLFRLGAAAIGRRGGLLVAALGGLLPVGFWYARDATPYSLLGLISAAALWFAFSERWRAFSATLVVGFFLHYTVAVLGLVLGGALFWQARMTRDGARFRRALVAFAWVIPLPLAWSVHFIRTFLASGMSTRLMALDYNQDPGFFQYVRHFASVALGLPPSAWLALPVVLALLIWGARRLTRVWFSEGPAASAAVDAQLLIGRAAIIQVAMVVVYVLFIHQMYMAFAGGRVYYAYRWTTVFLPGVVLALGAALEALIRWRPRIGTAIAATQIAVLLYQDVQIIRLPQRPAQWAAAAKIRAEAQPGDAFCALPAVYFAQTLNYALFDRQPADLLALPRWSGPLYGPIHPVNTTVETVVQNLAFERVWVVAYDEEAFGTPEFDRASTENHLSWLHSHLVLDGRWAYPYLRLYRFRVPSRPETFWQKREAVLDFSKTYQGFRYFPDHLHTQETGYIMSRPEVRVRIPNPPDASQVGVAIEVSLGRPAMPSDLKVEGLDLAFGVTPGGGIWRGRLGVSGERTDFRLTRSPLATKEHRNTVMTFRVD